MRPLAVDTASNKKNAAKPSAEECVEPVAFQAAARFL
jgi:hypothetical protein